MSLMGAVGEGRTRRSEGGLGEAPQLSRVASGGWQREHSSGVLRSRLNSVLPLCHPGNHKRRAGIRRTRTPSWLAAQISDDKWVPSLCSCTPGLRVQLRPFAPRSPPYLLWVPVMRLEEGQEATCPTWDLAKPPWAPVPPNFLSSSPGKHVRFDGNPAPQTRGRGRGGEVWHVKCSVTAVV